jgi:glycosyltransferase involved in cell wall biosynthesis
MTKIAVLTPCIVPGDAVSNDVVGMYQAFSELGHNVRIFANTIGISEPTVHHVSGIRDFLRDSRSLFIYHFSVGWDEGLDLLMNLPCRKVVKYHNVTPPEFFEGINEDYANVCREGRRQLHNVAQTACDLFLFDSVYNMNEFISNGTDRARCVVVPPFHHIDRLSLLDADLNILNSYRDAKTNIIVVGRLAPNKGHLSLIEAFASYHYLYNKESRLFIVGKEDPRLSAYTDSLRRMIGSFRLGHSVVFTGGVTDSGLKAYYLLSHVFMITSEHEGFCVPLVEALSMKIPVVAYGTSAIPGTAGKAAIVWETPDPYLFAASVNRVVSDSSLSAGLGEIGWRHYREHFSNRKIGTLFLKSLRALL